LKNIKDLKKILDKIVKFHYKLNRSIEINIGGSNEPEFRIFREKMGRLHK
jgi:hypothetical protein